mmetsp:Transcript_10410/g.20069  ORF Transcript_10410/g.20069 Transcript_10410/m.20069 type:complete len:121 (-) Transcript_10410:471-833(-)
MERRPTLDFAITHANAHTMHTHSHPHARHATAAYCNACCGGPGLARNALLLIIIVLKIYPFEPQLLPIRVEALLVFLDNKGAVALRAEIKFAALHRTRESGLCQQRRHAQVANVLEIRHH